MSTIANSLIPTEAIKVDLAVYISTRDLLKMAFTVFAVAVAIMVSKSLIKS